MLDSADQVFAQLLCRRGFFCLVYNQDFTAELHKQIFEEVKAAPDIYFIPAGILQHRIEMIIRREKALVDLPPLRL